MERLNDGAADASKRYGVVKSAGGGGGDVVRTPLFTVDLMGKPGGDCHKCPLAQFGSAVDQKGQPGKGQACKSMRMLLFLRQDDMIPMIVNLPPTSLQNAKKLKEFLSANTD
jgi:hypothetical protein